VFFLFVELKKRAKIWFFARFFVPLQPQSCPDS